MHRHWILKFYDINHCMILSLISSIIVFDRLVMMSIERPMSPTGGMLSASGSFRINDVLPTPTSEYMDVDRDPHSTHPSPTLNTHQCTAVADFLLLERQCRQMQEALTGRQTEFDQLTHMQRTQETSVATQKRIIQRLEAQVSQYATRYSEDTRHMARVHLTTLHTTLLATLDYLNSLRNWLYYERSRIATAKEDVAVLQRQINNNRFIAEHMAPLPLDQIRLITEKTHQPLIDQLNAMVEAQTCFICAKDKYTHMMTCCHHVVCHACSTKLTSCPLCNRKAPDFSMVKIRMSS